MRSGEPPFVRAVMCCDQVTVVLLSARPKPLQSAHGLIGAANGSRDHLRVLMESRSAHNLSIGGGWALQQDTRPAPSELLEATSRHVPHSVNSSDAPLLSRQAWAGSPAGFNVDWIHDESLFFQWLRPTSRGWRGSVTGLVRHAILSTVDYLQRVHSCYTKHPTGR